MTMTSSPLPTPDTRPLSTLAVVGLVLAFFVNVIGLVISIIALVKLRTSGERGRGLAIAGIIVGSAWIVVFAVALIAHALVGLA